MHRRLFIRSFWQRAVADDYTERLADHYMSMDKLVRSHYGCTDEDISTATCKSHRARIDRRAYEAARNTAKRFFNFQD
jgi:ribosomal protein L16/L10AE